MSKARPLINIAMDPGFLFPTGNSLMLWPRGGIAETFCLTASALTTAFLMYREFPAVSDCVRSHILFGETMHRVLGNRHVALGTNGVFLTAAGIAIAGQDPANAVTCICWGLINVAVSTSNALTEKVNISALFAKAKALMLKTRRYGTPFLSFAAYSCLALDNFAHGKAVVLPIGEAAVGFACGLLGKDQIGRLAFTGTLATVSAMSALQGNWYTTIYTGLFAMGNFRSYWIIRGIEKKEVLLLQKLAKPMPIAKNILPVAPAA